MYIDVEKEITLLKTIADKNRLSILYVLQDKELCVCELQQVISLTQGALSIQLKNLQNIGLLSSRKKGKWVFYKLSDSLDAFQQTIISTTLAKIKNSDYIQQIDKIVIKEQICKS